MGYRIPGATSSFDGYVSRPSFVVEAMVNDTVAFSQYRARTSQTRNELALSDVSSFSLMLADMVDGGRFRGSLYFHG